MKRVLQIVFHSIDEAPALHWREAGGERFETSERLLLCDAEGNLALGYYVRRGDGELAFDADNIGFVVWWAIAPLPTDVVLTEA